MMLSMARAGLASLVIAFAAIGGLCGCLQKVDLRSTTTDAIIGLDTTSGTTDEPSPGVDSGSLDVGMSDPDPASETDSGPVIHDDAAPHEDAASHADADSHLDATSHDDAGPALDGGVNECEQAGFECLDSLTNGGVCPAPRMSEPQACPRLNDRERICCSRI